MDENGAWISVKDRKPENHLEVTVGEWVLSPNGWVWMTTVARLRRQGDYFVEQVTNNAKFAITHWLPHPLPPENDRRDKEEPDSADSHD
ncbi:MAG: DUF551 domain-containing protein [Pseudomonadota bacterium]